MLSAHLVPEIATIDEATKGLLAVVRRHTAETERVEIADSTVLWDLNTPEQYEKALKFNN